MLSSMYMDGTDVVGAVKPGPVLVLQLKDVGTLARKLGGSVGALAQDLSPQGVEVLAYGEAKRMIREELGKRGISAEVEVLDTAPRGRAFTPDIVRGIAVGAVGGAGVMTAVYFFIRALTRRS